MIKIMPAAVAEIARRLSGQPETLGLRIFIQGFGWGGPSLGLALGEPHEDDAKVEENGVRVYLQRRVAEWYAGAELGWETDAWGGGFTFNHPDLSSCG